MRTLYLTLFSLFIILSCTKENNNITPTSPSTGQIGNTGNGSNDSISGISIRVIGTYDEYSCLSPECLVEVGAVGDVFNANEYKYIFQLNGGDPDTVIAGTHDYFNYNIIKLVDQDDFIFGNYLERELSITLIASGSQNSYSSDTSYSFRFRTPNIELSIDEEVITDFDLLNSYTFSHGNSFTFLGNQIISFNLAFDDRDINISMGGLAPPQYTTLTVGEPGSAGYLAMTPGTVYISYNDDTYNNFDSFHTMANNPAPPTSIGWISYWDFAPLEGPYGIKGLIYMSLEMEVARWTTGGNYETKTINILLQDIAYNPYD